jgi:hypothetical protein
MGFFFHNKNSVSVEGEIFTSREMQAGVLQDSVLSPTLFNMHINDALQHMAFI